MKARDCRIKSVTDNRQKQIHSLLAAFFFPVLTCCIGFAAVGIFTFGSRSALIIDGVHQYLGFYEEFLHQIGQGVWWTFSGHAMGYSFYSLFSYYLSSPFNFLILCGTGKIWSWKQMWRNAYWYRQIRA